MAATITHREFKLPLSTLAKRFGEFETIDSRIPLADWLFDGSTKTALIYGANE